MVRLFTVYVLTYYEIVLDSQWTHYWFSIGTHRTFTGLSPGFLRTRTGLFMILLGFHAEFRVLRLKNLADVLIIRFSLTPSAIFSEVNFSLGSVLD